jgi:hypothetical protein
MEEKGKEGVDGRIEMSSSDLCVVHSLYLCMHKTTMLSNNLNILLVSIPDHSSYFASTTIIFWTYAMPR